ncbi:synaptojanin-1 isoform X1 [Hydra vulgaris]|uniref:synaptojanin-1 isoform X1 n=1 Tax=Hydra vulgaris TaxID=6087 RepID=UPI001F5FA054|nr:synaptojanin-1 [Hydra vulgaris]
MTIGRHFLCSIKHDEVSGEKSVLLQRRNNNEVLLLHHKVASILCPDEFEAIKRHFVKNLEAYACLGVLKLYVDEEYCFMYLFFVTGCISIGKIASTDIYRISNCSYLPLQAASECDSRINDLQKLLMSGCFYFSINGETDNCFELSLTAQNQHFQKVPDSRFFWNNSMHNHLKQFNINPQNWFVQMMCGGVEIRTLYIGAKQARACLISRLSGERAGTRFNVRGTNDDGHVANFVETEQLIILDNGTRSSFIQTRGSVPLFWEQTGVQVGAHKVKMSRGYEASSPAFERHLSNLKHIYGYQLLVNLLGHKGGEAILSNSYKDHLKDSSHSFDTHMIVFDYHSHCGGGKTENIKILMEKAKPSMDNFQFFTLLDDKLVSSQVGTIRTNCIDCLDRTNAVQTEIGLNLLKKQLESIGINDLQSQTKFHEAMKVMWEVNGDHISRMYTGTGAMEAGTKGTIGSKLHDGAISVKRTLKNNFFDGSKQEAIDILLLGNSFIGSVGERARALLGKSFLYAPPKILRGICLRHKQFTKIHNMRVTVSTWNVNGGKHFRSIAYKHQSMHDWLLDYYKLAKEGILDNTETFEKVTDVYAIGFEELVDLNTGNIISTSSSQKKEWGAKLQEVISRNHPYVLISAEQLVGVCLFVFVRLQHVPYIRDVAVSVVKTGLKGNAGNKGAVAVRMLFHSTSLCFVCGHFAAGQSNALERNNNYHDISRRLAFPMGTSLAFHDYVFWCGDFNYRINLPYNEVKELLKDKDWPTLLSNDQLLMHKADGKVFGDYIEGTINFPPTYKYDLFSNDYDTSEKMRTPAWTDRVLWRRKKYDVESEDESDEDDIPPDWKVSKDDSTDTFNPGNIVYYGRAELKTSDHRPVIAVIDIEVEQTLKSKLQEVQKEVMKDSELNEPTVSIDVEFDGSEMEIDLDKLVLLLSEYGNLVMLRLLDNRFYCTFDNGVSAKNAVDLNEKKFGNGTLRVTLVCGNYLQHSEDSFGTFVDDFVGDLIHKDEDDDDFSFNDKQKKVPSKQHEISKLLFSAVGRQGSILEPEVLNQQADYIEDYLEELPDDILEEEFPLEDEEDKECDEEVTAKLKYDITSTLPSTKPKLQGKVNKDSAVISVPPKRPNIPPSKATTKPEKPQPPILKHKTNIITEQPIPVSSVLDPPNSQSVYPVKAPAPPRPATAPKKAVNKEEPLREIESRQVDLKLQQAIGSNADDSVDIKVDDGVSKPFNIQHLMHVDHSNVDEFISKMTLDQTSNKTRKLSIKAAKPIHSSKSLSQLPQISKPATELVVNTNLISSEQPPKKPAPPSRIPSHISKSNSIDSFLNTEIQNEQNQKKPVPSLRISDNISRSNSVESCLNADVPNIPAVHSLTDKQPIVSSSQPLKKPPPRPKLRPVTLNLEDMMMDSQLPHNNIKNIPSNVSSPLEDFHQVYSKNPSKGWSIGQEQIPKENANLDLHQNHLLSKNSLLNCSEIQSSNSSDENIEVLNKQKDINKTIHSQLSDNNNKISVETFGKNRALPPLPPRSNVQPVELINKTEFSLDYISENSNISLQLNGKEALNKIPPPLPKRSDIKIPPPLPPR